MPYLDDHIRLTKSSFDETFAKACEWASLPQAEREATYKINRQWFLYEPVYESSVFLYFDLSGSSDAVQYAEGVQNACKAFLGSEGFNCAPSHRLHTVLFTEAVLRNGRLADHWVAEVRAKYEPLLRTMHKSVLFIMGPRLTSGGVVLECRIFDDSIASARAAASSMASKEQPPRIPTIDYATLGYITSGTREELEQLNVRLKTFSDEQAPIPVPVDRVFTSLTVNKRLTEPTLTAELTLPVRVVLSSDAMSEGLE